MDIRRKDTPENRAFWESVERAKDEWENVKPDWARKLENKKRKSRFETTVLEGLLYLASDRGANSLLSPEEYLVSEITAGTCEYIIGEEIKDIHPQVLDRHSWTRRVNKNLDALDSQTKFSPALAGAIKSLAYIRWVHGHGESWWESQIRYWLMFGEHNRMQSTFAFTVPQAREIEGSLKTLDPDILRHVENIAEIMKRYIREDLVYIAQHYRW